MMNVSAAYNEYNEIVASVPGLPLTNYVRDLIARGWANRNSGKAWDDSSRESRTVVGQYRYTSRAPRGAGVARYFLDIRLF